MPRISERLRNLFGRTTIHVSLMPEENPRVDGLSARQLYATQANLHAVVSFLADSVSQLPLKVYSRSGENDRQRDRESVAAKLLYRPNADQTAYEFWNATVTELLLMGVSTVWVLPDAYAEAYTLFFSLFTLVAAENAMMQANSGAISSGLFPRSGTSAPPPICRICMVLAAESISGCGRW